MRLDIDYNISDLMSDVESKYLLKYKKEITNIISFVIIKEMFIKWKKENKEINLKDIKSCVKKISVSISFVDEKMIKDLNSEYRKIDKITDVLSFPIQEKSDIKKIKRCINSNKKTNDNEKNNIYSEILLGDIFICLPKIVEQATEYEHSIERELMYMIVHGMHHLFGYDHIEDSDKAIMRKKEESVLKKFKYGVERDIVEKE